MSILTKKDIERIEHKILYWDEIMEREGTTKTLLEKEAIREACELGPKLLLILKEYLSSINNKNKNE